MVSADELALMVKNGQLSQLREYGGTEALAAKLSCFDVNKGLDTETTDFEEIKKRYGKNELQPPFVPRYLSLVYENLQDATIILLIIAAIVSLILGIAFEEDKSTAWIEGAAILVAVAFVVNFQAWTDYNNAKTFRNQFYDLESAKRVNVLRDGRLQVIHPTDLVVGDILRLETGAIVAADGVLVDGRALKLDEAALTGESKQFAKQPFDMSKAMTENQPSPFILSGTSVVNGEGRMLVVAVGPNSLQGKILTTVIHQDEPAAEQTRGSSHALNPPSLHSIQSSKRRETDLSVLKEHEPLDASGSGVEVDVELPHVDVKPFLTNSNRGQSVRSTQFSLRSDKNMSDHESQSYTSLTKFAVPRKRRYDRIPCARASSTVTGRNLTEKLDKLAIDIGKFGFAIATIVFIVMCIRWSVEEFVDQGSCPLFNGNYTLCSTDAKLLGCSMDISLNATCTRVWNGANDFSQLLRFFITAVTILVVVVPEGLPLAVTLSLSLSMRRMAKENNQVKNMDSSETMGSATTVCTDKTGTLTENRMTCVRLLLADKEFRGDYSKTLGAQLQASSELTYQVNLLLNACSLATNPASSTSGGNATDAALLRMTQQAEFDWAGIRASAKPDNPSADWGVCYYPFSSTRKRCSVVVQNSDGSYRVFSIGAPQYVLETCTSVLRGTAATSPYDESAKKEIDKKIQDFAHDALRTIAISYKDMAAPPAGGWESPANGYESVDGQVLVYAIEQGLTLLAIVGIEDPLRPGIKEAIAKCYSAGVDVRMCTGDALETAVAISLQCGILRPTDMETDENGRLIPKPMFAMTGAEFDERIHTRDNDKPRVWRRAYDFKTNKFGEMKAPPFKVDSRGQKILNKKAFDEIWPKLRVLARCLPEDKLTLVKGLKGSDLFLRPDKVAELKQKHGIVVYPDFQVVAVTGDGTNDAPALKSADVGFAMGIAGTDIAKQACDIILLDDNFSSIVTAIKWGRNVFDSISKFVQFQLTVNLVAVVVASVGAFAFSRSPLGPVQMLWVNLIMDSFASFALATDPPSEILLDRPPYGKRRPIVSFIMGFNIVGQAGLQIALLMGLLFNASWIPDTDWKVGTVPKYPPSESSVLLDAVQGQVQVDDGVSVHWTIIFNAFVMLQLANQVNCRKLQTIHRLRTTWSEWNPLERICSNWLFNVIILLELAGQIIIVQLAGKTFTVTALSLSQWVFCLGLGLLSFLWQWVLNIAVILIDECTTKKSSAERLQPVVGSHRDLVVQVQPEEA